MWQSDFFFFSQEKGRAAQMHQKAWGKQSESKRRTETYVEMEAENAVRSPLKSAVT